MQKKKLTLAELEFSTIRKLLLGLSMMGKPDLTAYRREVMDDGYGPGYWIYDIKPEMAGSEGLAEVFNKHHVRDSDTWEIIDPQPPVWSEMQRWLLSIGLAKIGEDEDASLIGFDYREVVRH